MGGNVACIVVSISECTETNDAGVTLCLSSALLMTLKFQSVLSIIGVAKTKKQAICGVPILAWHQLFCLENSLMLSGNQ
jgi:hypothetical protein